MTNRISVVISAFNEEKNIGDCLQSIKWADEIILVDNTSSDKTVSIAKKYTSKIFKRPNNRMLNINKNYGFEKATNKWILNLDADERVTEELKREIINVINNNSDDFDGFEIPRKNIIFGKWIRHGIWWPDYQIRLFKKGKGKFECRHVHEKIKLEGKLGQLSQPLLHYNYKSISEYIRKFNDIYTENEVENFLKSGKRIYWYDAIRMPVNEFLSVFLARSIYKDGLHGLVLSILQAFYALVTFCKVWERQKFWEYNNSKFLNEVKQEINKSFKDYKYWTQNANLKNLIRKIIGEKIWIKLRSIKAK